jgi:transposase
MMGHKERQFTPLEHLTLEDLVPPTHFYRLLDRTLDLSFVRELVAPCYAAGGRPSIDPVVFFRLPLVLFFEGIRSERQLMRVLAERLAARWCWDIGYDLTEPSPCPITPA